MTWRSHRVTDRAHSFSKSEMVSDCGSALGQDCAQFAMVNVEEYFLTKKGERVVLVRPPHACGSCLRSRRKRVRETVKTAA